jgi:Trk K+ transport system NAD-binding subunit
MVAQLAVYQFSIKRVIARVVDRDKESIFNANGIQTFCPVSLSQERIGQLLSADDPVDGQTVDTEGREQ